MIKVIPPPNCYTIARRSGEVRTDGLTFGGLFKGTREPDEVIFFHSCKDRDTFYEDIGDCLVLNSFAKANILEQVTCFRKNKMIYVGFVRKTIGSKENHRLSFCVLRKEGEAPTTIEFHNGVAVNCFFRLNSPYMKFISKLPPYFKAWETFELPKEYPISKYIKDFLEEKVPST